MQIEKLKLNQVRKFLNNKGFGIFKIKQNRKDIQSIYLTFLFSLFFISFFYFVPEIVRFKNEISTNSLEVKNNSKNGLEKVLTKKEIKNDQKINQKFVFEDIFTIDDIPIDTVRLDASTIAQLFKDTDYNLKKVRKNKLVKPISLSLLPGQMKSIESVKKRKNLFIQIVLPLILEENNKIKLDRKKLFRILNKNHNSIAEKKWLDKKFKLYGVSKRDVSTLKIRMDEIPVSLAIAQAAKETGWGTSRFAVEGNALFGQWTFSGDGLKPKNSDNDATHKVMKFKILKASVRAYQRNLNTHSGYQEFRRARAELRDNDQKLDSLILANYLDNYAQTGSEYTKILKKIIEQNSLKDFDDAKLLPSSFVEKSLI